MRIVFLILALVTFSSVCIGLDVNVNLFTGQVEKSIEVGHHTGRYVISDGISEIATVSQGEAFTFIYTDTLIQLVDKGVVVAGAASFSVKGLAMSNSFCLKAGSYPLRYYDDDLLLEWRQGSIAVTNVVDLEKYVGGVIQAEAGGSTSSVEYFMVQAIISRTYAMRLIMNNGSGFCLKDDVSNQVYKGRPSKPQILEAVVRTTGEVIMYDDSTLVNAVFHSNSGGYTMSSDEVWVSSLPYLKAVEDTFSIAQRNYTWTYRMPVVEWLNYLDVKWKFPLENDSLKGLALNYLQQRRTKFFLCDIPLTQIRSDLNLKSTFFDISVEHDQVVFSGRGYGHGVGLSQEGAIRMTDLGYTPYEILKFYYTGIQIKKLPDLTSLAYVQ